MDIDPRRAFSVLPESLANELTTEFSKIVTAYAERRWEQAELDAGRIMAGVDVWPLEPVPADDPFRRVENLVFSGHRAGGTGTAQPAVVRAALLGVGEDLVGLGD